MCARVQRDEAEAHSLQRVVSPRRTSLGHAIREIVTANPQVTTVEIYAAIQPQFAHEMQTYVRERIVRTKSDTLRKLKRDNAQAQRPGDTV